MHFLERHLKYKNATETEEHTVKRQWLDNSWTESAAAQAMESSNTALQLRLFHMT